MITDRVDARFNRFPVRNYSVNAQPRATSHKRRAGQARPFTYQRAAPGTGSFIASP
ncbi:hypothetical protein L810_3491 [Burkholderia sp. AU4i]|nr:hypothetical protein L810_3491 [Burkholderia sp. AU4i]